MSATSRLRVERLLQESVEGARTREARAFEDLAGAFSRSLVLFGAGGFGRRALAGLRRHGIEPIAFCDSNPNSWNTKVDGVEILSPAEAARRFGKTSAFIITIWGAFAKDRMSDREAQLAALGCDKVIPFAYLFWKYPDGVLPHYGADVPHKVIEQKAQVLKAFDLWADEQSRWEYVAQLRWRLFFDCEGLPAPDREGIYFPPDLFCVRDEEVFVDCGAFDGDTLRLFLRKSNLTFKEIFALEPDPANFARLQLCVASLPPDIQERIQLACAAVGAVRGNVRFTAAGQPSSFVGKGDLEVESVRLDDHLRGVVPTYIKMDIEGAEPDALAGAATLIRDHAPLLAISCYHSQDHLWSIPLLIQSLNSDYRFFLRPHDSEMFDLVCYGIPLSRLGKDEPRLRL